MNDKYGMADEPLEGNGLDKITLLKDLVQLYTRLFGSVTADMYSKFYMDKDIQTILTSANELVIEYAGKEKAKELLQTIIKK